MAILALGGCQMLPSIDLLDNPVQSASIPDLPEYESPTWVAIQGLPVRRSWLKEGRTEIRNGEMYILPHVLTGLPYKNNQETREWIDYINKTYKPDPPWRYLPERRKGHYKCMSVSASTILDWFALQRGEALKPYQSLLNGQTEHGFDHRALDAIYYKRAQLDETAEIYQLITIAKDPVEQTPVSYRMDAFVDIITTAGHNADPDVVVEALDPSLPAVRHRIRVGDLPPLRARRLFGYTPTWDVRTNPAPLIDAMVRSLETTGPVFAGLRLRFAASGGVITAGQARALAMPDLSAHGVVVVGYIRQRGRTYFVYRETFGEYDEGWADGGPAYRVFPIHSFNEAWVFERVG